MIAHIRINDFAIIDNLSVDFHPGLNIITGETGAGKSIIIEAISLALGSRADSTFIRSGKEKARVQVQFDHIPPSAIPLLEEMGIEPSEEIVITRELSLNGKNICRINSQIVPLSALSRFCKTLADIHGQYDHQSLLNPENHLSFVDMFAPDRILPHMEGVRQSFLEVQRLKSQLSALQKSEAEFLRKKDFMEFELEEIRSAHLAPGEDEELAERIPLLQNSERIIESLLTSYDLLYGTEASILARIKKASDSLSHSEGFSRDIQQQKEVLDDCYYRLQDTAEELRKFQDHFTYDKDALDQAIERQERIEQLKRKYGGSIESILDYQKQLQEQLSLLEDASYNREHLNQELTASETLLKTRCRDLTIDRKDAALRLKSLLEAELTELNFKDAKMDVLFQEIPPGEEGADQVEFLICTNKGEVPKPLAKTASGGEISRIMLAFKSILGNGDALPTLIFDEIDSGISGITASVVGNKLRKLSREHQILCITHLPQIAAFGDHHYRIIKLDTGERITTTVEPLDQDGVLSEIARLTGGLSITKATLENARELLESGRKQD